MDESFQTVGGAKVGALGAIGIPAERYNHFCGVVHAVKRDVYGTFELTDHEMKGNGTFAKSLFRLPAEVEAKALAVAERATETLVDDGGIVFAQWTDDQKLLSLRNTTSDQLTGPYIALLHDFCRAMRTREDHERGALFLDQMGHAEDKHAACTIANYIARTQNRFVLQRLMLQVPHYTHSVVSPGLQMADLVAYLAANQIHPNVRPELKPWWERFEKMATFDYKSFSTGNAKTQTAAGRYEEPDRQPTLRGDW